MAIPSVTCGIDQVLDFSDSSREISLTAIATESPTSWRWDMLSIPDGSLANSGVNHDFTDGVATIQNPHFEIDANVAGTYVLQCVATNGEGSSNPAIDKEAAQQLIVVKTLHGKAMVPGKYAYDWSKYVNPTLFEVSDAADGRRTLNTLGAAPTVIYSLPVEANSAVWLEATVTAYSTGSMFFRRLLAVAHRVAGDVVIDDIAVILSSSVGAPTWTTDVVVDGTGAALNITVTGAALTSVYWSSSARINTVQTA
jgi:hypothetical protein